MRPLPPIHLCIQQPAGYVHSLGLLDPARYFRWQFRRLGAEVTVAKNRLRHDAVNFVFGAHLGFEATQCERHACIVVNLEQLGVGGATVSPAYRQLLERSAVVDYDRENCTAYAGGDEAMVVPLLHAPYLRAAAPMRLEERPIDLLFIGSLNERRRAWLDRIRAQGRSVTTLATALYGAERDALIVQAKAVVNAHFYETSRFEQARVAHCLSLGTPVVSERTARTRPHAAFEDCVLWLEDEAQLAQFFRDDFATPAFFEVSRAALARFTEADPIEAYADLLAFAGGFGQAHAARRPTTPWRPTRINLGSGKDYRAGWLNLDVLDRAEPDLVLDLSAPLDLPVERGSATLGPVRLEAGSVELIRADNVLEHVPDLPALLTQCLALLKVGGELHVEVPYEAAATAWQDPTHVRAMNENSWLYVTDWFWYLGWFEHRFAVGASGWLDAALKPCEKATAAFMRLVLTKVETTAAERTTARTFQPELRLPDDAVAPAQRHRSGAEEAVAAPVPSPASA